MDIKGRAEKAKKYRKYGDERLDRKVFVYLTEAQHINLVHRAEAHELSVSCFIRKKLKDDGLI